MLSNKVAVGLIALVALGGAAGAGTYLASRQPVTPAKSSRRHAAIHHSVRERSGRGHRSGDGRQGRRDETGLGAGPFGVCSGRACAGACGCPARGSRAEDTAPGIRPRRAGEAFGAGEGAGHGVRPAGG